MRRRWWTFGLVAALAAGLGLGAGTEAPAAPKGRVVMVLGTDPSTLDPHMHALRVGIITEFQMFDTLLERDLKTMAPVPKLAESVKPITDLTWEVKLRPGVKFHNGEPMNAEAVKFTLDRIVNPEQKSPTRGNYTWIRAVEVVDDLTVRIHTQKPFPLIHERLIYTYVLPPRYLKSVGDAGFARAPVGTGPFKFVEWKKGDRIVMEANEQYWRGAPAIKTLVIRTIRETATQIAEMLTGGVDLIRTVPPDQIPVLEANPNIRVSATKILRVVYLMMDADGKATPGGPLTKLKVRQAISHAVNVEEIMQKILGGKAVRIHTPVNPLQFGHDPTITTYPFNPARAKQLLAEAGFPNGFEVPLNSYAGSVVSVDQVGDAVAGYLATVGITAKRRHFADVGRYQRTMLEGKLDGINIDSWGSGSVFDADAILYQRFHSKEAYSYATHPDLDGWLDGGRSTLDPAKRKELYARTQRLIHEQAFWVPMYAQFTIEAVNKRLNYEATPDEIQHVYKATWRE
jgi:peptide/nickel transport system substrate-binding protein